MVEHRAAFLSFLKFLKNNLSAQTAVRVDPAWASQASLLQGFAAFSTPDFIVREDRLQQDLAVLANLVGHQVMPGIRTQTDPYASRLDAIYDADVEAAAREACSRDYIAFGFADYKPA